MLDERQYALIRGWVQGGLELRECFLRLSEDLNHSTNAWAKLDEAVRRMIRESSPQVQLKSRSIRGPNMDELEALYGYMIMETGPLCDDHELSDLQDVLSRAFVSVCDDFMTDGPGFSGRTMLVMWPSGESELFTWDRNGNLESHYNSEAQKEMARLASMEDML